MIVPLSDLMVAMFATPPPESKNRQSGLRDVVAMIATKLNFIKQKIKKQFVLKAENTELDKFLS